MSSFKTPFISEDIGDGYRKVTEVFSFYVGDKEDSCVVEVPVGFISDGASVPKIFHSIVSPWSGNHAKAAVLHDYLYKTGHTSRFIADAVFFEAMVVSGVSPEMALGMYISVRLFGWKTWRKYRYE